MSRPLISSSNVILDCPAATIGDAVRAAAETFRDDPRVGRWKDFWASVAERQVADLKSCSCGVAIAHGRGESVKELVLAAVRLARPLPVQGGPDLRLVFVFGIPAAMAEEYLRTVGALARACGRSGSLGALLDAEAGADFASHVLELVG